MVPVKKKKKKSCQTETRSINHDKILKQSKNRMSCKNSTRKASERTGEIVEGIRKWHQFGKIKQEKC